MLPSLTRSNQMNGSTANTEPIRQVLLSYSAMIPKISDLQDLFTGQLGSSMLLPTRPTFRIFSGCRTISSGRSSLLSHVSKVFLVRTKKKVMWITAPRIITTVANFLIARRQPIDQFVRKSMGIELVLAVGELPVSPWQPSGEPRPAIARSLPVNLRPEPNNVAFRERRLVDDYHPFRSANLGSFSTREIKNGN